jgi:hypothetical protein
MGSHDGAIYVQSMPLMEDDERPAIDAAGTLLNSAISDKLWQKAKSHSVAVDLEMVNKIAKEQRAVAYPVSKRGLTPEQYLLSQARVHNRIPQGATWDGREELLVTAEEYEAVRAGKPLPKRPAAKNSASKRVSASDAGAGSGGAGGAKAAGSR